MQIYALGWASPPPPANWEEFIEETACTEMGLIKETQPVWGFPSGASGKEPACQCRRHKRCEFDPWVGKIPWGRAWQPTPVFSPGESWGQGSLECYSSKDCRVRHNWSNLAHSTTGTGMEQLGALPGVKRPEEGWDARAQSQRIPRLHVREPCTLVAKC